MCQECGFITGHANVCPNNPDIYEPILAECELCGKEFDEIDLMFGICEQCFADAHNFTNAINYGKENTASIKINGLFEKVLTPDQINEALFSAVMRMYSFYQPFTIKAANEFLTDDDGAFAQWLKEQKNID